MMGLNTVRVAVDIGGTFTDLVSIDNRGSITNVKVLTTPDEPSRGVLDVIERFLRTSHSNAEDIRLVIHATTLASNALLTDKIPKVALVTTKGFRDVLEIGRQNRPELYNLQVERPRPLAPRHLRFEIDERVSYDGAILKHIDSADSRKIAKRVRRSGSQSVAVCFLHSYANSSHERSFGKVLRKECSKAWVTLSSDLLPEFREYERTSTTVVNACLQPIISDYLETLATGLRAKRIQASIYMMQSNGGTISYKQAIDQPARVIESGPVAGAGPACYGLGGEEPTVTDAHLILGRLNPDYLLGGELRIHPQLARKAIDRKIGRSLGMTVEESALAILRIAIDNMFSALRAASVERGKDPRGMLLVAFGGAGPMHACEVAQQLGIRTVLIPRSAGLFSSLGLLLAEPMRDYVQTILVTLESVSVTSLNELFGRLEDEGAKSLAEQGVSGRMIHFERFLDLRYSGQGYELSIPIPRKALDRQLLSGTVKVFHNAHFSRYGHSDIESPVELVNLRLNCRGKQVNPTFERLEVSKNLSAKISRPVGFIEGRAKECPVYDRGSLGVGFIARGPAVLEDYDSTLIIPPRCRYIVDTYGSVIVTVT